MENVNEERPKPDTSRQAEIAFRLYDKDKDGYITKSEMEKLSKNLSKEQIDKVFARFDADGDGKLSYAEFRKMMNKWTRIFSTYSANFHYLIIAILQQKQNAILIHGGLKFKSTFGGCFLKNYIDSKIDLYEITGHGNVRLVPR